MLKAAFIPEQQNVILQNELSIEYNQLNYMCFVVELMADLKTSPELTNRFSQQLLLILNKIMLDNIFKHVVNKSASQMLHQLQSRTFTKDIDVNVFYLAQVLEFSHIDPIDRMEKENTIVRSICWYLDKLYTTNKDRLDAAIINMYNYLDSFFHYLSISYYKFELVDFRKPVLLYTERTDYATF